MENLEEHAAPTAFTLAAAGESAPPHASQFNNDMAIPDSQAPKVQILWGDVLPSENIALLSSSPPADDTPVAVQTPTLFQYSFTSTGSPQQGQTALAPPQSLRPISPLSSPPKPLPTPQANAGSGGGGGAGGRSTPDAGMGGSGPTGGGGGPGLVNANQFVGANFGAAQDSMTANVGQAFPPDSNSQSQAFQPDLQAAPLTALQTTYSMTPPSLLETQYQSFSPSLSHSHGHGQGHDPLYVLDMNNGETVPTK